MATGSTRSYLGINHYSTPAATQGSDRSVQLRRGSSVVASTADHIVSKSNSRAGSISETALSTAKSKSINLWTDLCWGRGGVVSSSAPKVGGQTSATNSTVSNEYICMHMSKYIYARILMKHLKTPCGQNQSICGLLFFGAAVGWSPFHQMKELPIFLYFCLFVLAHLSSF